MGEGNDDFSSAAVRLDRAASTPLWSQLEAELRRRMESGHFSERFPTDRELMEVYEVSRHTARQAVAPLGADGIVRRERGIGTSINRSSMERSLGALYSLFQVVEDSGVSQHSEARAIGHTENPEAAHQLGLESDADLVLIDRIRFAGSAPLALDRIWLPAAVGIPLLGVDFSHTSLYNELDRTMGAHPHEGWEQIQPAIPSVDDRQQLQLSDDEAVFSIKRLGICNGSPIEWRVTTIRGSRVSFIADWTVGQRNDISIRLINLEE